MLLDYPFLPPEINSGRIYTGPGSGPMMAAAAGWDGLAADLYSAANSYQSVISGLVSGWQGPSSAAMAAAATPYVGWMNATAAQAEQAGANAKAAAAAYETAYASSVPPPVIAANRAQLATLVATNILGQNAPAIAANEAQYGAMWAQDVGAMSGYDAASQATTTSLATFASPPVTTNPGAQPGQAASQTASSADATSNLAQSVSSWLTGAESWLTNAWSGLTTDATGLWNGLVGDYNSAWASLDGAFTSLTGGTSIESAVGSVGTALNGLLAGTSGTAGSSALSQSALQAVYLASVPARFALYPMSMLMQMAMRGGMMGSMGSMMGAQGMSGMGTLAGSETLMNSIGTFIDGKMGILTGGVANQLRTFGGAISAQLAHATSVGQMSVPQAWAGAAPAMSRALPVLPPTSVSAPAMSAPIASSMPGGPFTQALMGALSGRGLGGITGKVVPPKVIPKSPAAG